MTTARISRFIQSDDVIFKRAKAATPIKRSGLGNCPDFTLFIHDTGIHLTGVEIDAADIFGINLSLTHDKVLLCLWL